MITADKALDLIWQIRRFDQPVVIDKGEARVVYS